MASILKQRRDTAANWASANPVIPAGQLCFDTTNNTFKIGDGTATYSALSVQSGTPGASGGLQDIVEDLTPQLGGNLDLNSHNITGTGTIPSANLTGALPAISGAALTNLPGGGKVLQVVSSVSANAFSTTSASLVDITGLSATITPVSTSSKILVITNFYAGHGNTRPYPRFTLKRGTTSIGLGNASGNRSASTAALTSTNGNELNLLSVGHSLLDSPSTTSAITYKWQTNTLGGRTIYVNSAASSVDANSLATAGNITLMEIGV